MNRFNIADKIIDRLGRRGLLLLLFASIYVLFGIKAIAEPSEDAGRFMLYTVLPPLVRGLLWIGAATLAIFAATFKRGRNDGVGFAALCVPAAVLGTSYLISFIAYLVGITDYSTGWISALEWLTMLAVLQITSGWAEVEHEVIYVSLVDKKDN